MKNDVRYIQQTDALNKIAAKLGVVAYRPDYHGTQGDKNTVIFYIPEDEKHNRKVDQQTHHYTRSEAADRKEYSGIETPDRYVYRDSIWNFENSDRNGHLDMNHANHGTIDLRGDDWEERVEGRIRFALLKKGYGPYLRASSERLDLQKLDDALNNLSREILCAMKQAYGQVYLGVVNIRDDARRERICAGKESVLVKHAGQKLDNSCCEFAVPTKDEALEEIIREWISGTLLDPNPAGRITGRINELSGEYFYWR